MVMESAEQENYIVFETQIGKKKVELSQCAIYTAEKEMASFIGSMNDAVIRDTKKCRSLNFRAFTLYEVYCFHETPLYFLSR